VDAAATWVGKERRRRPRHGAAHWQGRYRFGGATGWRECELIDVSETGAGFQAFMLPTDASPLAEVELELVDRADPEPDPLRFTGRVRHLARSNAGHVRVGMEFAGLTDLEGRLLAMLFRRDGGRGARFRAPVVASTTGVDDPVVGPPG
jgi:hypothetical protein